MADEWWPQLEPHLAEQGYELVELECSRVGRRGLLRLFIDKPGGVTLDDCTAASQVLSTALDALDAFAGASYMLEVSSPGIARPLRKAVDFERFRGEPVEVRTETPIEGRRKFSGVLGGVEDGCAVVECTDGVHRIHLGNVQKAHLVR